MKKVLVIWLLAFVAFAGKCQKESDMPKFVADIAQKNWVHSYEDQKEEGVECFREDSYQFPPSRGRKGFSINADGTFWEHAIAATDGTQKKKGTWKAVSATQIAVSVEGNSYTLEWVAMEGGVLKLRRVAP